MTDLSLTIRQETADDALAIERLHERTFGPGRFAKTAYRFREGMSHVLELSFTARIGTLLVGSVRLTSIRISEARALLLGPLTVEPPFRERSIGQLLIERALAEAKAKGHRLVVLVGDEPRGRRGRAPDILLVSPYRSRPSAAARVPSFYALEAVRSAEGRLPDSGPPAQASLGS